MSLSYAEFSARIKLHSLPEIGPKRYQFLINRFNTAEAALAASAEQWRQLKLPSASISARNAAATQHQLDKTLKWLEASNHHLLFIDQPDYPALLKETEGAPSILFVNGQKSALHAPLIAIVGSRHASSSGQDLAFAFSKSLSSAGFIVTSGLALGIDAAAHQGAVSVKLPTLAVVGTGLDITYPAKHRALQEQILKTGGTIISELALGSPPHASHFPRRNRIISGLALGVLVVEASPKSGSLITARLAGEQGREVYAIPGSIHNPNARGCHQLIREGATLVETVEHILEELQGWKNHAATPNPSSNPARSLPAHTEQLPPEQQMILRALQAQSLQTEEIAAITQLPITQLLVLLSDLEINGLISNEHGLWLYRLN